MTIACVILCLGVWWLAGHWRASRAEAAYPPLGKFIQVTGCHYHYKRAGRGLPVILLHGAGASLEDYANGIFEQLAAEFQVVAIDRPGHGYSGRPRGDCGTPEAQAHVIRQILDALEINEAILVAHSWSGALALAYALGYPGKTLGLVLLQGTVYPQPVRTNAMLRALALPLIGYWLAHLVMPWIGRGAVRRTLERAFAPDPIPPGYLPRAMAMWTRPGQSRAIAVDACRREATIDALGRRYRAISAPVRLVVADDDRYIDPHGQLLRLQHELKDVKLTVLPGGGHQVPQTHPTAVLAAVRELAAFISTPAA